MSGLSCTDPGYTLIYENPKTSPPYSADFYCLAPPPTPRPTPTPQPTATPRPARIPQDRESRLAGITVLINASGGSGTGFFALTGDRDRYYVFTNEHVVGNDREVSVYWHLARQTLTANVLRKNANLDIAVLDLQPSDFRSYPGGWDNFSYSRSDNYDRGDEVWIAGYPGDMGVRQGRAPVVRDGAIYQKRLQRYAGGIAYLEHSVATAPGSSGSPILNRRDEIIAIATAGNSEAERIGLGVPLWAVYRWLETGDDSSRRDDILQQSDGAYWAVLTWEENGQWQATRTPEGYYCITQIWETEFDDGRKRYRWLDLCGNGLQGYVGEDEEIYFEHTGVTYYAPRVRLAGKPSG